MIQTGLVVICTTATILLALGTVIVLALIPLYVPNHSSAGTNSGSDDPAFTLRYSISEGNLTTGAVTGQQLTSITAQLAKLSRSDVELAIESVEVVESVSRNVESRASSQKVLFVRGILKAKSGCSRLCLGAAARQFRSNICASQVSLLQ